MPSAELKTRRPAAEDEWISVSDLMAGLMVIFLFIAIVYIRPMQDAQQKVRDIAVTWQEAETEIYEALEAEFEDDLERWQAELDPATLAVRFKAPDVLFVMNEATLRPRFQQIIESFFPRYLQVLSEFEDAIEEIRIEGHTSSEWNDFVTPQRAYFLNMALSQERTRSVLEYALSMPETAPFRVWAYATVTANGLSSSTPIYAEDGTEDRELSRRVEFRVRTKTESRIIQILETVE